jgi:hypothetical protein
VREPDAETGVSCVHCGRPAKRAGLCWTHVWRARHGKELSADIRKRDMTPIQLLTEAALNYADATEDEEYRWALARLRMAALRYVRRTEISQNSA